MSGFYIGSPLFGLFLIVVALAVGAIKADARGNRREKRELEDRQRKEQDDASGQPPTG
jgi:hypothetical protein